MRSQQVILAVVKRVENVRMNKIDLQKFCADEDDLRHYLWRPFSQGEYTYALDGHIAVRVPRIFYISEVDRTPDCSKIFPVVFPECSLRLCEFKFPEEELIKCLHCSNGIVYQEAHECPTCECEGELNCEDCRGVGKINSDTKTSIGIDGSCFSMLYIRLILDLPNPVFQWPIAPGADRACFTFDGGDGALIAQRRYDNRHFELQNLNPVLKADEFSKDSVALASE